MKAHCHMTSNSYGDSADGPALLRPRRNLLQADQENNPNNHSCYYCLCFRGNCCAWVENRAIFNIMAKPKLFRQVKYDIKGWWVTSRCQSNLYECNPDDRADLKPRILHYLLLSCSYFTSSTFCRSSVGWCSCVDSLSAEKGGLCVLYLHTPLLQGPFVKSTM